MATTAITGKQVTFTYATISGTAQITTAKVDETASSSTIQTLGGSVAVAQGIESKVSADFLYDGGLPTAGFYAALKAAFDAGTAGALSIVADGGTWTGSAIVTSLSAEFPADNAATCSAEFTVSGTLPFTPGTLVAAAAEPAGAPA